MAVENPGTHKNRNVVVSKCGDRIIDYGLSTERIEPNGLFSDFLDPDRQFKLKLMARMRRGIKAAGLEDDTDTIED